MIDDVAEFINDISIDELKRGRIIEIRISDLAFAGKGIAKVRTDQGNFIVFVPNTIPGQLVKGKVMKKSKRHAECRLIKILEKSPLEIAHSYQPVSGAPYASLPIQLQHSYKKRNALDQYKRIAHVANIEEKFDEFILSPSIWNYRNKMQYSFSAIRWNIGDEESSDGFALGSKKRGVWWAVENLERASGIFDEEFENKLNMIRQYLEKTGLPAYHYVRNEGFYKILQVQKSFLEDAFLINLNTTSSYINEFDAVAFYKFLQSEFPNRIKGFIHTIQDQDGDRMNTKSQDITAQFGYDSITEEISGLTFKIDSSSFFQPNPKAAELLYNKVTEYVFDEPVKGTVMDLFCGTGTIAQIIAKKQSTEKVIGVEIVEEAVSNAKINAKANNINNVKFFAEDVGPFLKNHPEYIDQIDVLILDPPRGGVTRKAIRAALRLNADRIVYVSCNPATQARDIKHFEEFNYEIKKLSLVDQFPHTSHIESIILFKKKDRS